MLMARSIAAIAAGFAVSAAALPATAQPSPPTYHQFVGGFVSAKGERALMMGYPPALEVWTYPLQVVSDLQISFVEPGALAPLAAQPLLRDVVRTPTEVIRTYVGPDFEVKEHLFVPRQQAGAILTYEVTGRPDIGIQVRFKPSLDLMWPGALGGQSIRWDDSRSGYVESEPLYHYSATIASPDAIAHDTTINRTQALSDHVSMLLHPHAAGQVKTATLVLALDPLSDADGAALLRARLDDAERDAQSHAADVLAGALQIDTPDADVNAALQSATLALDQAWACNDRLGCGELGGFGPSRPGRRPQYAWFFAGDGLVAMQGMLDSGQFERARQELAFVTRYQDPKSGMIWHEMSQSAGWLDWAGHYPYMYVHVDISFQYLSALAAYLKATGDTAFIRRNGHAIDLAWRYCLSTIDSSTGLPRIPAGKQGQDEQHPLRDDIRLSSAWVGAADAMVELAKATNHADLAKTAAADAAHARASIAGTDWDAQRSFWLEGHTLSGEPVQSRRSDAIHILDQNVFNTRQTETLLDALSSPAFISDWGLRSLDDTDPGYDPNAYSSGSVWALGTSSAAEVFWHHHRAATAWRLWHGLVQWNTLDSAGHIHEVLAGDIFHPEYESVPEQTWSSAGLLSAATHGLLGLEIDALRSEISFAPQLPEGWRHLQLRNVPVGPSRIAMALDYGATDITLTIDNPSAPVSIRFDPGAAYSVASSETAATCTPAPCRLKAAEVSGSTDISFEAPTGRTQVRLPRLPIR